MCAAGMSYSDVELSPERVLHFEKSPPEGVFDSENPWSSSIAAETGMVVSEATMHISSLPTEQKMRGWEGQLEFLNQEMCYININEPTGSGSIGTLSGHRKSALFSTFSDVEYRKAKCRNAWRKFCAAFRKTGHMRRLPPDWPLARARNWVGEVVLSPGVQAAVVLATCVDVLETAYVLLLESQGRGGHSDFLFTLRSILVVLLGVEVAARMFYYGKRFTHSILNLLEFGLIPLAIFELTTRSDARAEHEDRLAARLPMIRTLRPIIRFLNLVLKVSRGYNRVIQFRSTVTLEVSGCKRRYRKDTFDLDLCYIIPHRLIAMGRPAVGPDSLYNNPLSEVVRFFDSKHTNKYLIVCINDRCDYASSHFHHRVLLFPVLEAGVPRLQDLWDCCEILKAFLDRHKKHEENVCAMHTQLGSGRVGMVLAAMLLFSGTCDQADEAVNHVEKRRTDPYSAVTVHAVECASQQRFLEYFSVCKRELQGIPEQPRNVKLRHVKILGVEPELASELLVRCYAHNGRTAAKSLINVESDERARKNDERSSWRASKSGTSSLFTNDRPDREGEEALMLIENGEDILEMARHEQEHQEFDSVESGCTPQRGEPLFDTNADIQEDRATDSLSDAIIWQIEKDLCGEVCFEIHRKKQAHDGSDEDTQLLLATWLHTSFLEISGDTHMDRRNLLTHVDNRGVLCVTLRRFDLDKAKKAPGLRSYGSSFELQLLFEVEEPMLFGLRGRNYNDSGRLSGAFRPDFDCAIKLAPPSYTEDVSEKHSVDWLSWCVQKLWNYIEAALLQLLEDAIQTHLQSAVWTARFGGVHINEFCLGNSDTAPSFPSLKASIRSGEHPGIQLDIDLSYSGNANVVLNVGPSKAGVTSVNLSGTISLLFNPIVEELPIIGGLQIFFLNPPEVHMQWVGMAEIVELPLLRDLVITEIHKAICSTIVLPNVMTINWMPETTETGVGNTWLSSTLPISSLCVDVLDLQMEDAPEWQCGAQMLHCMYSEKRKSRYVIFRLGGLEHSAEDLELDEGIGQPKHCLASCCLLVHDVQQRFSVEVWERELGRRTLLGKSAALEVVAVSDIGEGGRCSLFSADGEDRHQNVMWLELDMPCPSGNVGNIDLTNSGSTSHSVEALEESDSGAGEKKTNRRVKIDTRLFELHSDRGELEVACATAEQAASTIKNELVVAPGEPHGSLGPPCQTVFPPYRDTEPEVQLHSERDLASSSEPKVTAQECMFGPDVAKLATPLSLIASPQPSPRTSTWPQSSVVAVLICSVKKGRLPDVYPANKFVLHARVGTQESCSPFEVSDLSWRNTMKVSEITAATVAALANEGHTPERIAATLKMDAFLVSKVIAYKLGYNAELRQNLCIFVRHDALLPSKNSNGALSADSLELEVSRNNVTQAVINVSLDVLRSARGMLLRRVLELQPPVPSDEATHAEPLELTDVMGRMRTNAGEALRAVATMARNVTCAAEEGDRVQGQFDLDCELRLLAFVPPKCGSDIKNNNAL